MRALLSPPRGLLLLAPALVAGTPATNKQAFLARHNISRSIEVRPYVHKRASTNGKTEMQRRAHLLRALEHVPAELWRSGLFLEFGVRDARMLRQLAAAHNRTTWHGFDSFRGLPRSGVRSERWKAGQFDQQGRLPRVPANVRLHAGWFNETLPPFLASVPHAPLAFMHLDADIYESTHAVLEAAFSRCRPAVGTVLAFDELFGSQAQLGHEYRALTEAAATHRFAYEWVSYTLTPGSPFARAAVRLTDVACRAARKPP